MEMLSFYDRNLSGSVDYGSWIEGLSKINFIYLGDMVTLLSLFSKSLPNWLPVPIDYICLYLTWTQTTMICMTYGTLRIHQFL